METSHPDHGPRDDESRRNSAAALIVKSSIGFLVGSFVSFSIFVVAISSLPKPFDGMLAWLFFTPLVTALAVAVFWPTRRVSPDWQRWSSVVPLAVVSLLVLLSGSLGIAFLALISAFDNGLR